ncbi:MAG: PAS domain-containing protein [Bacteroidales bacterium]
MMKLGARDYIVKDLYFLSKIPTVSEQIIHEIQKDKKLKEAEETIRIRDKKLIEEKQKLANIIKAANVGTWEWHIPSGKLILNERCAEISGYSLDEIIPIDVEGVKRFLHPEDLKMFRKAMRDHLNGIKDYYETEFRIWQDWKAPFFRDQASDQCNQIINK